MKNSILVVIALLVSNNLLAQIVNVESKRMQTDSSRIKFRGDLSTSYVNNDGNYIINIKSNVVSQYRSKDQKSIFFFIGNYGIIRAEEQDFNNTWFFHLRHNYQISKRLQTELFIQNQYNELLDVTTRNLFGAGLRLKVISKEYLSMHIGNAYMYEIENSNTLNEHFLNHRNSTYLSLSVTTPNSKLEIINTIYFQPLYTCFDDFTVLEQLKVDVEISKKTSMFTLFNYYHDNITPEIRAQFNSQLSFGMGIKL
ncbi:MAG: DUF481 domain-containing protein [Reichenbachiella sp.]|uniref:DUF481 domain-containing protein n=1 Tax=Reichenbachiella sp. TaxID=2184521 RepID=UPI003263A365